MLKTYPLKGGRRGPYSLVAKGLLTRKPSQEHKETLRFQTDAIRKRLYNEEDLAIAQRVVSDKATYYPRNLLRAVLPNVEHRTLKYLNNGLERDHDHLKQRLYAMRRFKQAASATIIARGHALIRSLRNGFAQRAPDSTWAVPRVLRLSTAWPQLAHAI